MSNHSRFRRMVRRTVLLSLVMFASGPVLAVVDSLDGPPPCGADNICNFGACSNDPDCPANMPQNEPDDDSPQAPQNSGGESLGLDEVIDCNATQSKDIRAVAWNIADDWTNFERQVRNASSSNLGACIEKRFSRNGKVQCVAKYKCKKDGRCKLGFGAGLGQKVKLYQTFFDNIASLSQKSRRACYAAMLTHEFSHTCEHYAEGGPEARAEGAFDYWKARFDPNSTLDIEVDCGMND